MTGILMALAAVLGLSASDFGAGGRLRASAVLNLVADLGDIADARLETRAFARERTAMSARLNKMRFEYARLLAGLRAAGPIGPPDRAQRMARALALSRAIEEEDRRITRWANGETADIFSELCDKLKARRSAGTGP